jgi:hypothetical protein
VVAEKSSHRIIRENLYKTARLEMTSSTKTNNIPNDATDFVSGIDLARMFYMGTAAVRVSVF